MYQMNLVYNPDHQQVLEHHQELLKKAAQEQLVRASLPKSKHALPSFRKLLQLVSSVRHTHKVVPSTTQ
jgi:hypothetical protein